MSRVCSLCLGTGEISQRLRADGPVQVMPCPRCEARKARKNEKEGKDEKSKSPFVRRRRAKSGKSKWAQPRKSHKRPEGYGESD